MFIVGRAVTGIGAAGIFSGILSILAIVVPLSKRALYTAMMTSLYGVAVISGPIIGGALTTKASWRWCFYINLPLGAVTLTLLALFFKPPIRKSDRVPLREKLLKIDFVGCLLFMPTIVMVLLALQWGGHRYEWKSATIIGLLCGSAGMAIIFCFWEHRKGEKAMIPFSILLHRSILLSCVFATFNFGGYIGNIYYMPEWFQVVKGASALHSGVMTLPAIVSQIVAAGISGLISKSPYHQVSIMGDHENDLRFSKSHRLLQSMVLCRRWFHGHCIRSLHYLYSLITFCTMDLVPDPPGSWWRGYESTSSRDPSCLSIKIAPDPNRYISDRRLPVFRRRFIPKCGPGGLPESAGEVASR